MGTEMGTEMGIGMVMVVVV
ncbi:uncharacterized protein CPUR_02286 [Claviceps purpurea 20.1]|uniref:Uncharacterized protein n=1 Tax=Claviceps purpurea (strain 20.1) TaxID=1111077 RepID=M1WC34_CLAP2|nr:uncharacterized protein CPUR_02286 [Claviceps purpurea 20.1]